MSTPALRREEAIGLVLAVALHAALAVVLMSQPDAPPPPLPERITVTIADTVAPADTAPEPQAKAAPDTAPMLGEPAPAPSAAPVPKPEPKPEPVKVAPKPEPKPVPKPLPRVQPEPKPVPRPVVKPVAKSAPVPSPKPVTVTKSAPSPSRPAPVKQAAIPRNRPDPIAEALAGSKASGPAKSAAPTAAKTIKPPKQAGGSKIDDNFLKGLGSQSTGKAATPAAAAIGPEVKAGLRSALSRQIKPKWTSPQGADIEQLVTVLAFDLNEDGSLAGTPRVVRQEGITESNRTQAPRHAEQAIRAVRLAAPFDLPKQYYTAWKHVTAFSFDRKLSQ